MKLNISLASAAFKDSNAQFERLVTMRTRITLLSDVCQSAGYPQGRSINAVLQVLTGEESIHLISDLGAVQRVCTWEKLALDNKLGDGHTRGNGEQMPPTVDQSAATGAATVVSSERPAEQGTAQPLQNATPEGSSVSTITSTLQNSQVITHLTEECTKALKKFFQGASLILAHFHSRSKAAG